MGGGATTKKVLPRTLDRGGAKIHTYLIATSFPGVPGASEVGAQITKNWRGIARPPFVFVVAAAALRDERLWPSLQA
jgi:hypothetical protein